MRRLAGFLIAIVLATTVAIVTPQWTEACRLITPENPLWYVFGCFIDPPPGDPSA